MFTLEYAKNPVYNNTEETSIILTVKWEEFNEEMPFTAVPWDNEPWGRELFENAKKGVYGNVAPYTPSDPYIPNADDNKKTAIKKLQETDWAATVDISNPQFSNPYLANQDAFLAYRSQIREYAVNPVAGFINWPIEPTAVWVNT